MSRFVWMNLLLIWVLAVITGCQSSPSGAARPEVQWVPVDPAVYQESSIVTQRPGYCDRYARSLKVLDRYARFEKADVKVFHLTLRGENKEFYSTPYWTDLDTYPEHPIYQDPQPASLEVQAESILKSTPDARFVVHFFAAPPVKWAKRFPDQLQTGSDGKVYRAASYASESWLVGQEKMIHNLVRHMQSLPWGKQVDGYVIIPHTEGATELSVYGEPFDTSAAMQTAYAKFIASKYKTDADLQHAWGNESITLKTVKVPTLSEYQQASTTWLTWPEPQETRLFRDYFLLQRQLFENALDRMAKAVHEAADGDQFALLDALKQPLSGWLITDAFDAAGKGMSFPNMLLASGSFDAGSILDLPSIDGFMTPADYTARSTGWGFDLEGISDSVILRNKIMYAEDDARSWTKKYSRQTQGAWRTPQEARAGMLRNLAMCASRGVSHYWANAGDGFFDGDGIMEVVTELLPQARAALSTPVAHTQHAIAMILDDTSAISTDFTSGFSQLAVMQQRVQELALTGLPYRVYLLSDMKRDDFPRFRTYLFPDLFELTPEKMALIQKKVFRDGSVAIFGPATGVASDDGRSAKLVSAFLGIELELKAKKAARRVLVAAGSHPALSQVANPVVYGDSYPYGPILTPKIDPQEGVTELGRANIFWGSNTAGLVMREFGKGAVKSKLGNNPDSSVNSHASGRGPGDYAVVFSCATPIPATVLRSLALYAGCTPWSDLGDAVNASGRMVSIHSAKPGPRTIHLPEPAYVTDLLTGLKSAEPILKIKTTLKNPGTRLYLLDPVSR